MNNCSGRIYATNCSGRIHPTRKSAFTMIEMLIVLAIMVIVTAASIPSFMKFTNTARLRAAARDICTALRSARRYAITKRINYAVTIYLTDYSIDSMKNILSYYETADNVETQRAAANIYFTEKVDTSVDHFTFSFSPRGTTSGNTIRVVDPGDRYIDITVTAATGRVKIGDIQ